MIGERESPTPNPGSEEARKLGCKCPVMDNHGGQGVPVGNGDFMFWYTVDCPVHTVDTYD
jgi:hypothetical protein